MTVSPHFFSPTALKGYAWLSERRNRSDEMFEAFNLLSSHPHDLISAIDIQNLAGDRGCAVAGQEHSGRPQFVRQHIAFERRVRFIMFKHLSEAGNPSGR